jgi:enamine deaminase RidA (YjgF/YER057c/UK114 family)
MPIDSRPQPTSSPASPARPAAARLRREHTRDLDLIAVESAGMSEFHLTVTPVAGESCAALAGRVGDVLKTRGATVVRCIGFGPVIHRAAAVAAFTQAWADPELPVTWVEGAAWDGGALAGVQLHAVAGVPVQTLRDGDRVLGRLWRDPLATHCVLADVGPTRLDASRPDQARETLERLQAGLARAEMSLKHLARTWFFLDDILSWYDGFNQVRSDFFARTELRPGSFPASTGIAGRNAAGAALTAAAWAVQPRSPAAPSVTIVPSPRQCPAPAYGSAFSRAVEIQSAGFRQLLVSGTASISPDGRTAHAGDVGAQIGLTMAVVAALLESRGMSATDVSRATAYFKSGGDVPVFENWRSRSAWSVVPVISTCCDICRGDLLFEIEVDALQAG